MSPYLVLWFQSECKHYKAFGKLFVLADMVVLLENVWYLSQKCILVTELYSSVHFSFTLIVV